MKVDPVIVARGWRAQCSVGAGTAIGVGGFVGTLLIAAFLAGCGSTASTLLPGAAPATINGNDQPMARPKYAAWIAASAKRCGFSRSPEAIKAAYLAFEAKQGAAKEQLAKLAESYDLALKSTSDQVGIEPNFCTNKKVAEIKLAFQRQDAGDYAPNFPKPVVDNCGVFGCPPPRAPDEPFDSKKFWDQKNEELGPRQ